MRSVTLQEIDHAIVGACAGDTCSPDDVSEWSESNPTRGHCAVAALVVHDLLGGRLLCAEVAVDGDKVGYHWWNRVAGADVDLTLVQFEPHEVIGEPDEIERPVGKPTKYDDQYRIFRQRVLENLGR